jgi:protein-S-isoprenylcysteine O-methyltransferase Ste14
MFGVGALMNSLSLMVLFTPIFALLNALEIRFIEEPELELRLGEPYREYRRRVPMFFPRIGPRKG